MHSDDVLISISLATVEFTDAAGGTRLRYTEQGAYFDDPEAPTRREHGMGGLLDALAAEVEAGG